MAKYIEREAFEKLPEVAEILNEEKSHFNGDFYNLPFNSCAESFINGAWYGFQEAKKLEGCVVVPESELTNTFYWPDSEYVVDCPFDYDFELDKGEIQVIEKWQRTKSTKIYFANIYKDEESFEITEFHSLEEAQDAVKENNAYLESEEFFNLAEAARCGNEH